LSKDLVPIVPSDERVVEMGEEGELNNMEGSPLNEADFRLCLDLSWYACIADNVVEEVLLTASPALEIREWRLCTVAFFSLCSSVYDALCLAHFLCKTLRSLGDDSPPEK
jgi:hypothetical protein